jgi:hypothetical protein
MSEEDIGDDELMDILMKNEYDIGVMVGKGLEHRRIIELLQLEASEWLSHEGGCDCFIRGEEVLRLIAKIEETR